jgi:cellobiose-specific phosphotransferase system component IIA
MKCFITSFITDPQSYRGPITGIYIDTINSIAGRLLTDLVRADPASAHDIIKKYSEENGILLDLSYISDVGMTKFLGDLGGQKIAVLKALNANKVKVSDEFEKTITSTLAKVKNAEFTAAINAIQNNDHTILTKFAQDWVLDKKTFDDCTKALIDIHPHKLQLLLATLSEAHYLKKEMHVTKNCRDQYKEIKKANTTELVQSILADVPNADELIDEFIRSLKLLDLNSMDIADIMKLLRTENDILINRLVTDDKILFDWSKLIEEGDNTDLLFTLANTAMMASNDDKIENLKKANTQNFVKNISQHQDPVVLVDQFIGMLGRLDLTLLETDEINALFNEDSEALINKILTTEGVIIDWSKPTGDAHHTFLYQLAHMREGKFEKAAIDIFNAHQEDWHLIGGVMPGGHVGLEFGDYIDQD